MCYSGFVLHCSVALALEKAADGELHVERIDIVPHAHQANA